MVDTNIIREPVKSEIDGTDDLFGQGMTPVLTPKGVPKTEQSKFREKVEKMSAEYLRKKKPFCARCAYLDYKKVKSDIIEAERTGYVDFKRLGIKLPKLEEYGAEDRFEFVREGETMDPGRWKGDPITHKKWKEYKCKVRGCGITIFEA